jgi:hypothetical protein
MADRDHRQESYDHRQDGKLTSGKLYAERIRQVHSKRGTIKNIAMYGKYCTAVEERAMRI